MTESEIQKLIIDYFESCGDIPMRMNSGLVKKGTRYIRLQKAGTPDLFVVRKSGNNLWIEVKRPGEKPDSDQVKMINILQSYGETVIVATSLTDVINK